MECDINQYSGQNSIRSTRDHSRSSLGANLMTLGPGPLSLGIKHAEVIHKGFINEHQPVVYPMPTLLA